MDIQIRLTQDTGVYTDKDTVSGYILLRIDSPVSISEIAVKLTGKSISRLRSGQTESHQILDNVQHVFPPHKLAELPISGSMTVGCGLHIFPFSLTLPQLTECQNANKGNTKPSTTCTGLLYRRNKTVHILRQLPPSTGDSTCSAEIQYYLDVTVVKTGMFKGIEKLTQDVLYFPIPDLRFWEGMTQRHPLNVRLDSNRASNPITYNVDVTLLNGPYLYLGSPIPLKVQLTATHGTRFSVWLNDFQTLLLGEAEFRAGGLTERDTQVHIIQTMTNIRYNVYNSDSSSERAICIGENLWNNHRVPDTAMPSFETCNINQSYKLDVRLGFQSGISKLTTTVLEFRFPVHLIAPPMVHESQEVELVKQYDY